MKHDFAFSRINFILLAVGMAIVILGFLLMSGKGTDLTHFEPAIFDALHIRVAPLVTLAGYLFIIVAILYRRKAGKGAASHLKGNETEKK